MVLCFGNWEEFLGEGTVDRVWRGKKGANLDHVKSLLLPAD